MRQDMAVIAGSSQGDGGEGFGRDFILHYLALRMFTGISAD
jgi:hypothetical protein